MAKKWKLESAKAGVTTADRRVLAAVTAVTAAPTLATDGFSTQQNDVLHVMFDTGGTNPVFGLRVWWYSAISGTWHRGETLTVKADDITTIDVNALDKVYLQVTSVAGTTPTLSAWIGLVVQVS